MMEFNRLTIGAVLNRQAERYGDRDAVAYADRDVRWTYRDFRRRVDQVANGLMTLGIRKSEHVAVWAPNIPEWLLLQYATAKIGAVLVPVSTSNKPAELDRILRHSEATTLFMVPGFRGADFVQSLRELVPDLDSAPVGHATFENYPRLRRLFVFGRKRLPGMLRFDDLFDLAAQAQEGDLRRRESALDNFDVINLQYTSGTTGRPKGVMLTHRSMLQNAFAITLCQNLSHLDRLCFPVPLFHCFGCSAASLGAVVRASCMVPVESFEPGAVLAAVMNEKCTALYGTPTMFRALFAHPQFADFDVSTLRTGIMAGAPCPVDLIDAVFDRLGASDFTVAYGLTESSPGVTQTRLDDPPEKRRTTVGRALPGMQVQIRSTISGRECERGLPGELLSRGHSTMKGYLKDQAATAAAIDDESFLHTGDLATMDADGYVNIVGRIKDTIIRGGENVYPAEVEEFVRTYPQVADVAIFGVPSMMYGEEVCAAVVAKPGETIEHDELTAFCERGIAREKVPSLVMTVDALPVGATGKVDKSTLLALAIACFNRQADADITTA
ncbi:MAG TPA: AMP-binding protein [Candidatus Eremiobacteraceae bacterium]|nr:AMP-binding protein [Candidatus Eremiobacteraceae bacterium]